ncbi:biotin transporter BioY [Klugiella xanthotipulae]|uniref:Biotin transporter n=1 Tax=Klugiella xanthotipulae TaxID=244735 RepID=A0A543I4S8_9MICO|nr:biotin transporter BioY [Klugiella xanthotipulae]TQM65608.1 biotin transport system substrate-specific component [Klugiella xanthotipulae]
MTSLHLSPAPRFLADALPGARVRDALLVLGGVVALSILGQVAIPLPFTPVPLTLATGVVILMGAALGPTRASLSLGLHLIIGMLGAPVFAGHASGWAFASFGYLIGYIPAALLVGTLARRHADRSVWGTVGISVVGSATIYSFGVAWLVTFLGIDLAAALAIGVIPFLVGDAIKAAAAAALLPATWKAITRFSAQGAAPTRTDGYRPQPWESAR